MMMIKLGYWLTEAEKKLVRFVMRLLAHFVNEESSEIRVLAVSTIFSVVLLAMFSANIFLFFLLADVTFVLVVLWGLTIFFVVCLEAIDAFKKANSEEI